MKPPPDSPSLVYTYLQHVPIALQDTSVHFQATWKSLLLYLIQTTMAISIHCSPSNKEREDKKMKIRMKTRSKIILLFLFAISLFASCRKEERVVLVDDRLLDNPQVLNFVDRYFLCKNLDSDLTFVLKASNFNDSLELIIFPLIVQKDSIGPVPTSCLKYRGRTIFLRNNLEYTLPVNAKSRTVIVFKNAVRSLPASNPNYLKYPRWRVLIKNQESVIDSTLETFYMFPDRKYIPPKIKKEVLK